MLARLRSAAVLGIDAYLVEVEADLSNGLPSFSTVGLPQGAVKEGREAWEGEGCCVGSPLDGYAAAEPCDDDCCR